jgi:recombination protein RecR
MDLLERLISGLSRLPGLGKKSASRIVYHLLRTDDDFVKSLAADIAALRTTIQHCGICGIYTETDPCSICTDPSRDPSLLCVVEEPQDVITIEGLHEYRGFYHVLMGALSPINGIGPRNLRIEGLLRRVREGAVQEVILATNPTVEGETTALYVGKLLKEEGLNVSRLALGLPLGGDLEFADRQTLTRSLKGRQPL